jgi:hypothetical protein
MQDVGNPAYSGQPDVPARGGMRVNAGVPAWAVLRVGWRLLVEAIKHPTQER